MSKDGRAYLVPTPVDPGGAVCIRVYIPDHPLYIAAFWGAYGFFTTWVAWQRDALHMGLEAAKVWARWFDKARQEFIQNKGMCEMAITDIRVNPLDPCDLQAQIDGGEWVSKAKLSDCGGGCGTGGALRYNGSTMQQYDPCTGEWVDKGPASNPGQDGAQNPQWAGSDCGALLASSNLAQMIEDGKNKMCQLVGAGLGIGELALQLFTGLMTMVPGLSVYVQAVAFLQAAYAYLTVHYTDVASYDLFEALRGELSQFFSPDGSLTHANWQLMLDHVDDLRVAAGNPSPGYTALGYAWSWIDAAGPVGCVAANKGAGIETVNCEDGTWSHVFDFSKASGGFARLVNYPPDNTHVLGKYIEGLGWSTSGNGSEDDGVFISRAIEPTEFTEVELTYQTFLKQTGREGNTDMGCSLNNPSEHQAGYELDAATNGEVRTISWSGDLADVTRVDIVGYSGNGNAHVEGQSTVCIVAIFRGKGRDPFYG